MDHSYSYDNYNTEPYQIQTFRLRMGSEFICSLLTPIFGNFLLHDKKVRDASYYSALYIWDIDPWYWDFPGCKRRNLSTKMEFTLQIYFFTVTNLTLTISAKWLEDISAFCFGSRDRPNFTLLVRYRLSAATKHLQSVIGSVFSLSGCWSIT